MKKRLLATLLCLLVLLCGASALTDVPADAWYAANVTQMEQSGLLTGYPDGTFRPAQKMTRGEFLAVTARGLGLESVSTGGHWAQASAAAVRDQRNCWPIWSFADLDAPVTREEAAAVIMLAVLPDAEQGDWNTVVSRIADFDKISGSYQYLVERAYANGVIDGFPDGGFHPTETVTRAQASAILSRSFAMQKETEAPAAPTPSAPPSAAAALADGVRQNGWLRVENAQLVDQNGTPVVLHGMSSHGIQWYGHYASAGSIAETAAHGANVFRVAMYVGEGGYLSDPAGMQAKAFAAADNAIANDMYVILDWHILNGDTADPRRYQDEATAFFTAAATRYRDTPNVLYELCNEPNGSIDWSTGVKPYAQTVGTAIRAISPNCLLLVGSPTWSQDVDVAAADPLPLDNVLYTCHFYAGTHGAALREKIDRARALGAAVFVSEWGTSDASGNGGPYLEEARVWLNYMAQNGISWCNWSLCDKSETSAALSGGASAGGGWSETDLTASGRLVFAAFS